MNTVSYRPLPSEPYEDSESVRAAEPNHPPVKDNIWSYFPHWALVGCLLCTVVNAVIVAHVFKSTDGVQEQRNVRARLPRPNQYIGLDSINRTRLGTFRPDPIINHPLLLAQVDRGEPDLVFPDDPHRWFSWEGTVSPDDRRFFLAPTINTVAQFRVQDYGMEECQLAIDLPSPGVLLTLPTNKSYVLDATNVTVQVWRLDSDGPLDPRTLSWRSRPRRDELFAQLFLEKNGTALSTRFTCPSDSLQTFEFTCMEDAARCFVDLWQDKTEPLMGAYVIQHPTV